MQSGIAQASALPALNSSSFQLPHSYPESSEVWSWPGPQQRQQQPNPWPSPSQHEMSFEEMRARDENLGTAANGNFDNFPSSNSFDRIYASFQHPRWGSNHINQSNFGPSSQLDPGSWPQGFNSMLPEAQQQPASLQNHAPFSSLMDNRIGYAPGMFTVCLSCLKTFCQQLLEMLSMNRSHHAK